jgi:6-phospho-beta-glucosidase
MHHFGWVNGIWRGEQDLLPEALANAGQITPEVEPALVQAYGAIPCAYFGYFFHPERMLAKKLGKRTRAAELLELQEEILSEYQSLAQAEAQGPGANRPAALAKRKAKWYRVIIAPVLAALIETGRGGSAQSYRFVINLVNGTTVPWLPPDAIVEVPAEIRDGNITALPVRSLPEDVIEKMRTNCLYERMAVEAIISGDRALALRALLLNPMIHTYDQAAQVLERAWPR